MRRDQAMLNAFDPGKATELAAPEAAMIERRRSLLGPAYRLFYEEPLHIVRGEGVWLFDNDGKPYLDAYNNVESIGHSRPEVVAAIAEQAARLNTHTRYLHEGILDYANRLLSTFPQALCQAMFTCTGSEANDLALRIARRHTGGTGIIVTKLAYHGVTSAVAEISPALGPGVPLGLHVRTVEAPDTYRFGEEEIGARFTASVHSAIVDLQRHGIRPAALIFDTIFSSDGVYTQPPGFIRGAIEAIREAGGIFIADEVQAGFARTGSHMWGFQRHDVVPDLVTMGKPMGNGHPVAGLVAQPDILERFGEETRYFNTFGGNPVSCAAAMATLEIIQKDGLQANAAAIGEHIRSGFRRLAKKHSIIGDVRGDGLYIGVELVHDRASKHPARDEASRFVNDMRRRGVLLSATGPRGNVLKIRPLLPFTIENADQLLSVADDAFAAL
ncbi:MAG: aminotransferase class III-fold pyridoxal phosphate-dependent enzyme [Cupriavidus sp.]|nr:aminotransferase class III-fold pyridoxal phosphate-dependent enzyme [Cupriavidus sp.]